MEFGMSSVIFSIATNMINDSISQAGYGFIKKLLFPKKKYIDQLYIIIEQTTIKFEKNYPLENNQIPFYQSQPLFEVLNKHILFNDLPSRDELLTEFAKYPNINPPTNEQLENFYEIFLIEINNCNELKKLYISENYKEKIFYIAEEINKLKFTFQSLYEKEMFYLSDEWLNNHNKKAIADLGTRYTPKLNVKLKISNVFEGIGRTKSFSNMFYKYIDNFLIKGNKLEFCNEISEELVLISNSLTDIKTLYQSIDFLSMNQLPIDKFCKNISNCQNAISKSKVILQKIKQESKIDEGIKSNYSFMLQKLYKFDWECNILYEFLTSEIVKSSNNPFLILEGKAGMGKSHLLADIIESRIEEGYPSLFLLGQQFTTDESPWIQIFKRLQIKINSTEFLEKLNLYGEKKSKRFLIFIDAINEGNGNRFWVDYINSFIDEIKNFKWLGLVMSLRTMYKGITISNEQLSRNNFEVFEHLGFQNVELEAVNLFYDYYNIERPTSPNLNPEFRNPLFLKLLCEGIKKNGLTKLPIGSNGISKILSFFIEGINRSLASPKKYKFDPSFPLVNDALNELIRVKLSIGRKDIPLRKAHIAVQSVVKNYVSDNTFLTALIDEGILTKGIVRNQNNDPEEVVYISFERFDDHLTVKYLLDGVKNIRNEFRIGGRLKKFFKDESDFYNNQGIVEALSIQLPEKYHKELYELLPEFRDNENLRQGFIYSLVWRDVTAINFQKIKPFIKEQIIRFRSTFDNFLETLISVSALEDHPFNANFLHDWLSKYALPIRDAFWTTSLKHKYSESSNFRQLIDWARSDANKNYIPDNTIELIATTLCWFLTSSNRKLRDCSTKALVNLLEERISILIRIINKFDEINDPYIRERLYAVALGCTLRTKDHNKLTKLAETVFAKIFQPKIIYPHILLRDYAREIIEFISSQGLAPEGLKLSRITPPYNSKWPEHIPTKKELKSCYDKDEYWILWSSIMGGGDFARYIIGTNYNNSEWSGCKFGERPISRQDIFQKFYRKLTDKQKCLYDSIDPIIYDNNANVKLFSEISCSVVTGRNSNNEILSNKVIFKKSLSKELLKLFESEIEPYLDDNNKLLETGKHFDLRIAQRIIFNRVIELGWTPKLHGDFDNLIRNNRDRTELFQERIGKKYQWIAYYEYMAMLADNFIRFEQYHQNSQESPYQGPWDPYLRDIDPTMLLKKTCSKNLSYDEMWWVNKAAFDWDCTYEEWVNNSSLISNPNGLIEVKDNKGDNWLVLESHPSWKEPKTIGNDDWEIPRKEIWCQIRGYLVKSEEFENFKDWATDQHYMGRWMPEGGDIYQLFNREFYWSEAFQSLNSDNDYCLGWSVVNDRKSSKKIANVSVTSINYSWNSELDNSNEKALDFLKPSFLIFNKMNLKNGKVDGHYEDIKGNLICFSAETVSDSRKYLLIKKEPLLEMLKENNLEIVWTLLGEKRVVGGSLFSNEHYNRIEFSGSFYLDNEKLTGVCKTY